MDDNHDDGDMCFLTLQKETIGGALYSEIYNLFPGSRITKHDLVQKELNLHTQQSIFLYMVLPQTGYNTRQVLFNVLPTQSLFVIFILLISSP